METTIDSIDPEEVAEMEVVIPPYIDKAETMKMAEEEFNFSVDELEYLSQFFDEGVANSYNVPEGMLYGEEDVAISDPLARSSCSYRRHSYYGSCQDGVVPWGPCRYCTSCDHDWRMLYTKNMSGFRSQSSKWYYVPNNTPAVIATGYYKFNYTNGKYVSGSTSVSWMMMGDRAVNSVFLGSVDYAGVSFFVYRKLCR